jgi:hypothetical protein
MANTAPKTQTTTFAMRADLEFHRKVEKLSRLLPDDASKSDAVRYAVDIALDEMEKRKHAQRQDDRGV